ncbi:MAG: hypothetical protein BWX65_00328 [Bacteroidetes bacterium ADurb.Bin057]|nr:MAG: hypothetical protein BWX65_00328 [Bacteroidetes bacterium ADurb.Bin057]
MPAPSMAIVLHVPKSSSDLIRILRAKWVIVQNRNKMVKALHNADMAFTIIATCEGSEANNENIRAVSMKNGAPGGCPTSNL